MTGSATPSDAILERLLTLHPKLMDLTLGRTERLLDRLSNPVQSMPPVIHVAGTNGKGSTIAFVRAGIEAAGLSAHAYTSPHLARFHERIRLNGELIEETALSALLEECETKNQGDQITFFEITTAAAYLAFRAQRGGLYAVGGWAWRARRCNERHPQTTPDRHHARFNRSSTIPRRYIGGDRV